MLKSSLCLKAFTMAALVLLTGCQTTGEKNVAHSETATAVVSAADLPAPIRVLAWNLEHFTDPFDDPYIDNDSENLGAGKDETALELLAMALAITAPDVIVFEETESDRAVQFYLDQYMPGNDYDYYACVPSKEWHQNVIIVSRFPIVRIISMRETPTYNPVLDESRNLYNNRLIMAEIMPSPEYSFIIAGLHLKSGQDPEDFVWREEQVRLVKEVLAREITVNPETNIIIVGDMNFTPDTKAYQMMTSDIAPTTVDAFAGMGDVYTHPARAPRRHIDHIFVNEGMRRELVPASPTVPLPLSMARMARITDHLPVMASFYPKDL